MISYNILYDRIWYDIISYHLLCYTIVCFVIFYQIFIRPHLETTFPGSTAPGSKESLGEATHYFTTLNWSAQWRQDFGAKPMLRLVRLGDRGYLPF